MSIKDRVRMRRETLLSDNWYVLRKYEFDYLRRDGSWQPQVREAYDRGNGATILLYQPERRTVVLVRQFRLPVWLNGHDDLLIEAPAGLLDDADPAERIRAEVAEETGFRVDTVRKVFEAYMSPGSVTEKLHFFVAEYDPGARAGHGGGVEEEGEDIELLELPFEQAVAMMASGEINDAKTIMLLQYAQLHLFR
ncbi:NUDIX domain-containing protein [Chitinimonas lacunae]|uniref:GDP-mannose pyrophosphatase n=1 Tax=Chitinimonas lacunae TaxID=1963018 RepID=A0ABV8MMB9_9NEIS